MQPPWSDNKFFPWSETGMVLSKGETGRRLVDHFRKHLRDVEKTTQMHQNQLRAILNFLITPTTT